MARVQVTRCGILRPPPSAASRAQSSIPLLRCGHTTVRHGSCSMSSMVVNAHCRLARYGACSRVALVRRGGLCIE